MYNFKRPVACFQIHVNKGLKGLGGEEGGEVSEMEVKQGKGKRARNRLQGFMRSSPIKITPRENLAHAALPHCDLPQSAAPWEIASSKIKTFRDNQTLHLKGNPIKEASPPSTVTDETHSPASKQCLGSEASLASARASRETHVQPGREVRVWRINQQQ